MRLLVNYQLGEVNVKKPKKTGDDRRRDRRAGDSRVCLRIGDHL